MMIDNAPLVRDPPRAGAVHPRFVDVDPARLEAEEPPLRDARTVLAGAWTDYLTRTLPGAGSAGGQGRA